VATTPIPSPNANTPVPMPATFFKFYVGSTLVGGGMGFDKEDRFSGSFRQPFGQEPLQREPGQRDGRGSLSHSYLYGGDLIDACLAAGYITSDMAASGDIDFRFIPMTFNGTYNDGLRKRTVTLVNAFLTSLKLTITDGGTKLIDEDIAFDYEKSLRS